MLNLISFLILFFFSFNVYNNCSSTRKTQYVPTWLPKTLLEFLRIYIFGIYKVIISFDGRAGNLFSPYSVFWWSTHCTCSECCIENSVWSLSYGTKYYNVIIDDAVCRILNCRCTDKYEKINFNKIVGTSYCWMPAPCRILYTP